MIRLRAATLSFTLFSDLQATNEVLLQLVFIISGRRGMTGSQVLRVAARSLIINNINITLPLWY